MKKLSKRMLVIKNSFDFGKKYEFLEGISVLKRLSTVNFVESCDVSVHLGINAKKSNQNVRGHVLLPHGHGRVLRIVAFTQGINVNLAKSAGANLVGLDDIMDYVKDKKNKFDVVVATPDVMQKISQLGVILGPRGLMPNPKFGTVSQNIAEIIKKISFGQISYRNDKYGIVHSSIGKMSFDSRFLQENLKSLIVDLKKNKPSQSKGGYIRKLIISSTMGPSFKIEEGVFF